jgi:hypothetical protein
MAFRVKLTMATALGAVDQPWIVVLEALAEIRNSFAHRVEHEELTLEQAGKLAKAMVYYYGDTDDYSFDPDHAELCSDDEVEYLQSSYGSYIAVLLKKGFPRHRINVRLAILYMFLELRDKYKTFSKD